MKVHNSFQKQPLDRMICEARRINARPKENSLNSKQEHAKSGMIKMKLTSDIKEEREMREAVKSKIAADREKWKMAKTKATTQAEMKQETQTPQPVTMENTEPQKPQNHLQPLPAVLSFSCS